MTATIQEEPENVTVKDLYFKSPVVVRAYDPEIGDYKEYAIDEHTARSWISRNHQYFKKRKYKFWFEEYKSSYACIICQNGDPDVLEFHHLNPKEKKYNISTMIYQCMKLRDIQAELKKCVAVCSNCHTKIKNNSISYDDVLKKAKKVYSKYYRPGEDILKGFTKYMLLQCGPIIVYKYDDAYIRRFRVEYNFKDSDDDGEFKRHPDYINFCRKYIVGKEDDYDLGLCDEDEIGRFSEGWLRESYNINR